ncbi:MAG TPA: DUF1800 family protein [Steroidobacteraceae bacterium]|nr:DUF1800 family protein [Steroidobacteraceae bacterium]
MQEVERTPADDGHAAGLVAVTAVLALSACGGGGESSGSPSPGAGNAGPPPIPPTPIPPPPAAGPAPPPPRDVIPSTDAEAARFVLQAQFSVSDADITALRSAGVLAWLNARYSEPAGQTGVAWLDSRGHNAITEERRYRAHEYGDHMIWNQLIAGPDQMRKRMALALSEMFVVSSTPFTSLYPSCLIAAYWDVLTAHAFGNFRQLLEALTLNAAMGSFLNTRGNLREDSRGRQPDENYAREVMQLFTIGLYELNADGTHKSGADNKPVETYGQADVTNLARVFTGYDNDTVSNGGTTTTVSWERNPVPSTHLATNPMRFIASRHSTAEVNFLGTKITGTTPGQDALHIALDRLFYHDNTGPFFARQMIQRLVTSNPSPAYVQRVATVFGNNGAGVRGDLKAVWTAILTDEEARAMPAAADTMFGKMREPIVRFVQFARTVEAASTSGAYAIGDLSEPDTLLGQSPLRSPSVFNFFRPGYVPPNTAIAAAGKVAPEFQLHNETSTSGYINFMQRVTRNGLGDVRPAYSTLLPFAHDVPAVIDWLDLRLTANQLSSQTRAVLTTALATFNITAQSSDSARLDMLATACFLVMISPDYLVQK